MKQYLSPDQPKNENGLERCINIIAAAVMALRDCGESESDSDIAEALIAISIFGPLKVIKSMEGLSK